MRNENMKFLANLNGTILCPYQILLDIAEQIPNSPSRIKNIALMPICDLNSTNDWINLESLGKPVAIRAKEICDSISILLKKQEVSTLSLEIYINDGHLSSDNLYSLIFLAQSFNSLELTFVTQSEDSTYLKNKIKPLFTESSCSISFKSDTNLSDTLAHTNLLNQLKSARIQHIKTLGFTLDDDSLTHKHLLESTLNQLIGFSWLCLKSGGYDIGCRLLEEAQKHPSISPTAQEQLFMHLLMLRFFSHQYALITESDFPKQFISLEQTEIRTLQFLKAYSATLSRNLDVAQEFFTTCNINEQMPLSDEHSLYQLNLFALSRVLKGETDKAFELEFRIKEFITEHQIDIVGLKYVNFINIARLYKKIKEFDLSLEYYNKAYNEISGGGYTTSDHIYYNMNLGSLYEAAGNKDQALAYWVKAALHWQACSNKYELSWRPRLILCQEKISDISNPLPIDKAHVFLVNKLSELIDNCGVSLPEKTSQNYHFIEDRQNIAKEQCFINKNVVLYTCTAVPISSVKKPSSAEIELSRLLTQFIQSIMEIPENQNTLIIDTQLDTSFLNTAEEALAYAHLSDCNSCYFNGQWMNSNNLGVIKPMTASLSKVIQSMAQTEKGLSVQYKRSFLNKTLIEKNEIELVKLLEQTQTMSMDNLSPHTAGIIHQLSKKGILNFSYPS